MHKIYIHVHAWSAHRMVATGRWCVPWITSANCLKNRWSASNYMERVCIKRVRISSYINTTRCFELPMPIGQSLKNSVQIIGWKIIEIHPDSGAFLVVQPQYLSCLRKYEAPKKTLDQLSLCSWASLLTPTLSLWPLPLCVWPYQRPFLHARMSEIRILSKHIWQGP